MRRLTESTTFDCTTDRYWSLFWDEGVARRLYLEGLEFRAFSVLEKGEASRTLKLQPKMSLPAVVEKLLGPSFAYEEIGTLDREKGVWSWRMKSPLGNKLETRGSIRVEAAGDGRVKRTDEVTIEANVFGIGGVIESSAEKELRAAWPKEFAFWRKALAA